MTEMAKTSTQSDVWYVKARKEGDKRYWFVGSEGKLNRLRVHAIMFTHERAQDRVAVLAMDNPGFEFKTQRHS